MMLMSVDGNVGSSKRALMAGLSERGYTIVPTPDHVWENWTKLKTPDKDFFMCVVLLWYIIIGKKYTNKDGERVVVEKSPHTFYWSCAQTNGSNKPDRLDRVKNRLYNLACRVFDPQLYVFVSDTQTQCLRSMEKSHVRVPTIDFLRENDIALWNCVWELKKKNKTVAVL